MNGLDKRITDEFAEHNIEYVSAIPFEKCRIINERKLCTLGFTPRTVIIFAVPYFTGLHSGNISLYAMCKDYHLYFKSLFVCLESRLAEFFPNANFKGFADSSPIDEVTAAGQAGIGLIGKNRMLITEKYSSFVFLGSLLSDISFESVSSEADFSPCYCTGCGKCTESCPTLKCGCCLSELTQKKGELSELEKEYMKNCGYAWGCDICQLACPYTEKMIASGTVTPIDFFKNDLVFSLSKDLIQNTDRECFSQRAFSWRGKAVLLRNLSVWED